MYNIKVSLIVAVYNIEKYIVRCINSLMYQTYKNLEIIIIDDGSTDSSGKICKDYKKKDSRIVFQKNSGLSSARNTGIQLSTGEYISFVDGDDWLEKNAVEKMVSRIDKDVDIIITSFFRDFPKKIVSNESEFQGRVSREKCIEMMVKGNGITHSACAKLYKKELFNEVIFPIDKYYEDYYTIYYIIDRAKEIFVDGCATYHYVYRDGSIVSKPTVSKMTDLFEASKEIYQYIIEKYPYIKESAMELHLYDNLLIYVNLEDTKNQLSLLVSEELKQFSLIEILNSSIRNRVKYKYMLFRLNSKLFIWIMKKYFNRKERKNIIGEL